MSNNAGGLVLLLILPNIPDSYNSLIMGVVVVLGTALLLFVRVRYKRSNVDLKKGNAGMADPLLSE